MKIRIGAGIWLLLGVLVCVVILVLGLFLIVLPQRSKVSDVEDQIDSTEASIQSEKNRLNQLKQYEKDPEQFQRQIDALKEHVPDRVELADIIQQIDHAAEEAGLDFFAFTPKPPVVSENYYVVTGEVELIGRYFNLVEFFNHIERLPRTIKVVKIYILPSSDNLPYLDTKVTFRAFFTTDQGVEKILGQTQ